MSGKEGIRPTDNPLEFYTGWMLTKFVLVESILAPSFTSVYMLCLEFACIQYYTFWFDLCICYKGSIRKTDFMYTFLKSKLIYLYNI